MSSDYVDLLNKTAMLGRANGDLALARSAEQGAHMQANSASRRAKNAEKALNVSEKAHEETKRELAQAQAAILDWMHTNEAFKRLAKSYGKELQISDEQRQSDMDARLLDIAEEDSKFSKTYPYRQASLRRTGISTT